MRSAQLLMGGMLVFLLVSAAHADDAPDADTPDKSGYTLFNPTTDDQMRDFSTDRPGKTHSANTVDAGHFQLESDIATHTFDHFSSNAQTSNGYSVIAPTLKIGLTNWADLETSMALFNFASQKDRTTDTTTNGHGFGDFTFGSKINLFGNDGGDTALALIPVVKFPTACNTIGNGVAEYTLNAPYDINLPDKWAVTLEPALGMLKNNADNNLHGDYQMLGTLGHPVFTDSITGSVTLSSEYADGGQLTPNYTVGPALQWLAMPALQFDVGTNIGLNRASPDYNLYTGVSFRL